jgi:Fe-S oxidoreductase
MLTEAKRYLKKIMDALGAEIDAGLPIVVLEPSCASVFRDELRNLFPHDERTSRLRQQVFLLSEFLIKHAPEYEPPKLAARILLHGHCHHKALMKMNDEESLLRRMGAELECPDGGCCGMAGPFGFERGKFAIAQAIGERVLLPAVRSATPETIVVADGFSCREQIRQSTGRTAKHLADALHSALQGQRSG